MFSATCNFTLINALILLVAMPSAVLADARSDGERGIEEYRRGNLIEGMELLHKSATAGYAPAQTTLAFILDAAEDNEAAFRWYQEAADNNDAGGLFGLGSMYSKGEGVPKNPRKAGLLIRRAALLEHRQAMRVYAHALEHGLLGFASTPAEAAAWYIKAADLGDEVSMQRLQQAYSRGQLGLEVDQKQAAAWDVKLKQEKED